MADIAGEIVVKHELSNLLLNRFTWCDLSVRNAV